MNLSCSIILKSIGPSNSEQFFYSFMILLDQSSLFNCIIRVTWDFLDILQPNNKLQRLNAGAGMIIQLSSIKRDGKEIYENIQQR